MSSRVPFEGQIQERLENIKRQLADVERDVELCQLLGKQSPPAMSKPADTEAVLEDLVVAVRETGEQIVDRLDARDLQLARVHDLEERLRSVEQAIAEQDEEQPLLRKVNVRDEVFRHAARETSTPKAPGRPALIDYVPVINSAIQMIRDIALRMLERQQEQAQKRPTTGKAP